MNPTARGVKNTVGRKKIAEAALEIASSQGGDSDLLLELLQKTERPKGIGENREANRMEALGNLMEELAFPGRAANRVVEVVAEAAKAKEDQAAAIAANVTRQAKEAEREAFTRAEDLAQDEPPPAPKPDTKTKARKAVKAK